MAAARIYSRAVADEEWAFVAPYLALLCEEAPPRKYPLRALFKALRYLAHTGCPWRYLPHATVHRLLPTMSRDPCA